MSDQDGARCGSDFAEVFERELDYVEERWQTVYGDDHSRRLASRTEPTTANNLVGLAFSGGGIRSATINLGIAQALDQRGVFDHVDYMSTVSGGGYLGSSISTAMRRLPPKAEPGEEENHPFARGKGEFPFAIDFARDDSEACNDRIESPFLTWLRNNSNYMASGGFLDYARIGGVLLRGILVNFLVLLPILLILASLLFWRYDRQLDNLKETARLAVAAELRMSTAEAEAARLQALAEEAECGANPRCAERATVAESAAAAARDAATEARRAVPSWRSFFPGAPLLVGLFVTLALIFPVFIRVYKVYQHRRQRRTGQESSVGSRSLVEMTFAFSLAAIGVVILIEALPILIHYFHHFRDAEWRGTTAGLASGSALAAITAAGGLLSKLGGLRQKLLLVAIGLLGLVIPLVAMLYVTEGLIYHAWGALHVFDPWRPLAVPAEGAASSALWLLPGSLLVILGGGIGGAVVGRLAKRPSLGRKIASTLAVAIGAAGGYWAIQGFSHGLALISGGVTDVWPTTFVLGSALVVAVFCLLAVDVNLTGVLGLYRDRLASAYLIGLRKRRDKRGRLERDSDGSLTHAEEIFVEPDLDLEDLCGGTPPERPGNPAARQAWQNRWAGRATRWPSKAPYHLVNTTLNLQGSKDALLRDRNSDFMMFSKYYYGGARTGYCKTSHLEKVFPQMDLPTAMAISAAAASPNAGRMTSKPLVALMTLFNIRLGYWVPHPGRLCEWLRAKKLWQPELYHRWDWRIPPGALLREMFSRVDAEHDWVNLSDGGHIENMAVYELLRRRCRYIICGDGEADPELSFGGLATLMRYARIDMSIEIEILLDDLRLNDDRHSPQHAALGRIVYPGEHRQVQRPEPGSCPEPGCGRQLEEDPEADPRHRFRCPAGPEIGHLLYIKSSFSGNEDETMQEYRAKNPAFPHQTTADQFFDEGQFEAYRALGYHMADGLFAPIVGGQDPRNDWPAFRGWFQNLRADLAPRLSAKHAELGEQLRRIQKSLQREEYREYFLELHPELEGGARSEPEADPALTPQIAYLVGQQLALMENAFVSLNLDQPRNWNHEGNQGWRALFRRWAGAPSFARAYRHLGHLQSGRFQNFCSREFGLPDAAELWATAHPEVRPAIGE